MKKTIVGNRGHRNESKQSKETYNHRKIDYGRSFLKIKKILIVNLKSFRVLCTTTFVGNVLSK